VHWNTELVNIFSQMRRTKTGGSLLTLQSTEFQQSDSMIIYTNTMKSHRFQALDQAISRKPKSVTYHSGRVSDYYGEQVFNEAEMESYLPLTVYRRFREDVRQGRRSDRLVLDQIATAMKAWAISKGATHYTHWFQPLTGTTAEKHDAFLQIESGVALERFTGNQLMQQEPDASSLPSGGLRSTFEARGYTAWDPDSPAFIRDNTLCIPSVFISYTGEALDYKTPLLRAVSALDDAATAVAKLFDKEVKHVKPTLGWEQEYFLVDASLYYARPDLVLTGRTLFGHASAKSQQLEDHYFGVIPERVEAFMRDFEIEAHRLGIPVKTRHNEVAPNQYECAPVFEEMNLAVDHNQLIMDVIEKVARRHDYEALLHEKPYSGINGSGKHNNWSVMTDTGVNLLAPGKNSRENFRFLTFLVNIIKAVHEHADLLRASIASSANELRLGGNEAPPAIISVFIGSHLQGMLQELEDSEKFSAFFQNGGENRSLKIGKIPEILLDNTDRNRTSPFAFTGNKFEFRAVGSSANCASPMTTLTTIVAARLASFRLEVETMRKQGVKKEEAIFSILRQYISESKSILFEGNNYDEEWRLEAAKRGLSNIQSTPEALRSFISAEAIRLFREMDVLSETELHARYEIELERYIKKVQIEGRVVGDLARNHILPVAIRYQNILLENLRGLKEILPEDEYCREAAPVLAMIREISLQIAGITDGVQQMTDSRRVANRIAGSEAKAIAYHDTVMPWFERIRKCADTLELMVSDELWPLPKYRELLFTH
jgi:glutamine synthetase